MANALGTSVSCASAIGAMIWHKKNKQTITALFVERRPMYSHNRWSLMNDLLIISLLDALREFKR